MAAEQTGIAGEFWFFSQLQRLGYTAYITLGNTKSVDLALKLSDRKIITFDVKSKENFVGSYQHLNIREDEDHYYVFVNLEIHKDNSGKRELNEPSCFIVHSEDVKKIAFHWSSSSGLTSGFGFEAKLLPYLKGENQKVTENLINKFKERHNISEIDFDQYNKIIWSLADFEDNFYKLK